MTQTFLEHDLGCASFLRARGHILLRLVSLQGGRIAFEFVENDPSTVANDSRSYWEGALVSAEDIIHHLRALKQRLREYKTKKDVNKHACRQILRSGNRT